MSTIATHAPLQEPPSSITVWAGVQAWWWQLLAGLMAISGVMVALALAVLYQQILESGQRHSQTYGQFVAEESTRTLQTIDQRMELTALTLSHLNSASARNVPLVNAMLQDQIKVLPYVRALWFVNADGAVQYDSDPSNNVSDDGLPGTDVDYLALFAAQPQMNFYVGVPARGGKQGMWLVHAARPVRSTTGDVTGVLVAAIDPLYFESMWQKIDLGDQGSVALLTRDGTMLMRSPFLGASMGQSFKDRPVFKNYLPARDSGNYVDISSVDGVKRMFTYRTLAAHPDLVVVLGQSVRTVLEPWWRWVQLVVGVWTGAWAVIVTIAYALARSVRQKQAINQALRVQQERYHTLYLAAMDAIFITSPDGRVLQANPAACALFGRTEAEIQALGRRGLLDTTDPRLSHALAVRAATGHFSGELTCLRANGTPFEGEVTTKITTNYAGEVQGTVIIRDVSERHKSVLELKRLSDQLQDLSRRVINAQENERRRLAGELHDELGQALTAIKINLQSGANFKNRRPEDINAENIRIVEDTLQKVRHLALALRPSILDNLGLVPALNWLGKQAALRSRLVFAFHPIVLPQRLEPELESTCFRIAQEAITNIVRHAQAKHFSVAMSQVGHELVVLIRDDGVGMDWPAVQVAAVAGGSFGMLGMVERAALVAGELQVVSSTDGGCTLVLRLPLRALQELT
jgi:PAS domain S-box-containing protein